MSASIRVDVIASGFESHARIGDRADDVAW